MNYSEDVIIAASLAKIGLRQNEEELFSKEFERVFSDIQPILDADANGLKCMAFVNEELFAPFRKDEALPFTEGREKLQNQAPYIEDGCYLVPKILN